MLSLDRLIFCDSAVPTFSGISERKLIKLSDDIARFIRLVLLWEVLI